MTSDRDELKRTLAASDPEVGAYGLVEYDIYWSEFADAILSSDWLARVKAEAAATALEEEAKKQRDIWPNQWWVANRLQRRAAELRDGDN